MPERCLVPDSKPSMIWMWAKISETPMHQTMWTSLAPVRPAPMPALSRRRPDLTGRSGCPCGGNCPRCVSRPLVQAGLEIGAVDDPLEREADRVAESVLNTQIPSGFAGIATGPRTYARERTHALTGLLDRGRPLPPRLRAFMEPRFGRDFSRVRIHTDGRAADLARAVRAHAFTVGADIVLAAGQFLSSTESVQRLLAHELTHVAQQGMAVPIARGPTVGRDLEGPLRIRRVQWLPNERTGSCRRPWRGSSIIGEMLKAKTDKTESLDIWRPCDRATYWCHGFTFGGSSALGGPYSVFGSDVSKILKDDGWKSIPACKARPNDILVFYNAKREVTHSGIVRSSVVGPNEVVDEGGSMLESKWGAYPLDTKSWLSNTGYGKYRAYSKSPASASCSVLGRHELATDQPQPKSIIHQRIDVRAQFALQRLFRGSPEDERDAVALYQDVDEGRIKGVYGDDLRIAAILAAKRGTVRWNLHRLGDPPGADAVWIEDDAPDATLDTPVIVFRESAAHAPRLDDALMRVYRAKGRPPHVPVFPLDLPIAVVTSEDTKKERRVACPPKCAQQGDQVGDTIDYPLMREDAELQAERDSAHRVEP